MRRFVTLVLALLLVTAAGPALADPITTPGQTTPQVLTADATKMTTKARTTTGTTAVVGRSCTGYTSNVTPPSTIRVYRAGLGRVDVVNFNTYVKNVLPNEWIPSWRAESLKAGAMATKTYAWYRVLHWKGGSLNGVCYDLRDNTTDQSYKPNSALAATTAAVDATWSTRMMKGGSIFEAAYCSNMYCTFSVDACGAATNGVRLSQWGTQSCAGLGYGYQKILSTYYYTGLTFGSTALATASAAASVSSWAGHGDFTGDGKGDLLVRDGAGNLILKAGSGASTVTASRTIATGWGSYRGGVRADFTGDGKQDIIAQRADGSAVLFKGTWVAGSDLSSGIATTVPWSVDQRLVAPGDVNGDGKQDVYGVTPAGDLYFYAGNGNGTFASGVKVGGGWNRFKFVVGPGNLGGTAAPELVGIDATTGQWLVYSTTAAGGLAYQRTLYSGWNALDKVAAAGEFTGGTGSGVVAVRAATGTGLSLYRSTGSLTGPIASLGSYGTGWTAYDAFL